MDKYLEVVHPDEEMMKFKVAGLMLPEYELHYVFDEERLSKAAKVLVEG